MRIRIRPHEIDITEEEPFKNDLLGRKESAEVLTHLAESIEGPCVLAIEAAWGTGKTTFLKMWSHHLRKIEFPVIEFNAWETDFSGDPFIALCTELTEGINNKFDKNNKTGKKDWIEKINSLKKAAGTVVQLAAPGVVRSLTSGMLDIGPLLEKQSDHSSASSTEDRLNQYLDAKKCLGEFNRVLRDVAITLSNSHKNRPLIVVIDELDRCRPSYAVELLEVVKHLFEVDHIVFVLAINRSELAHSVRTLYGSGFDAERYLCRFFDVDFRLPEPERKAFIDAMISAVKIEEYFKRTLDKKVRTNALSFLLQAFFSDPDLSLRTIQEAIYRLGLVFASLRSDQYSFISMAVVLLIIRTIDSDIYYRLVRGEVTDSEVVKMVFDRSSMKDLRQRREGAFFEAMVILGMKEGTSEFFLGAIQSPLYKKYEDIVESESYDPVEIADHRYASEVFEFIERLRGESRDEGMLGFKHSAQRLELLTSFLIDERPEPASENS